VLRPTSTVMKSDPTLVTVAGTTRPSIMAEPVKLSSSIAAKSSVVGFRVCTAGIQAPEGLDVTGQPAHPADWLHHAACLNDVGRRLVQMQKPPKPTFSARYRNRHAGWVVHRRAA